MPKKVFANASDAVWFAFNPNPGVRRPFVHGNNAVGCNQYLLEGTYTYDQVLALNKLTGFNADFGLSDEIGYVAFIGIPNESYVQRNGYFNYLVQSYGSPFIETESYFETYSAEEAKAINNYTVYGLLGLEEVSAAAPISKIEYTSDSRYKAKTANVPRIFAMDCKVKGMYSFYMARKLATGTEQDKEYFSGNENPIVFATLEDAQHIGIINMWSSDIDHACGFRDVWEYGAEEPKIQPITFLTTKEAVKYNDYILYIYNYAESGVGENKYQLEKWDKTLDKRYTFCPPNQLDYRLVEHTELFR